MRAPFNPNPSLRQRVMLLRLLSYKKRRNRFSVETNKYFESHGHVYASIFSLFSITMLLWNRLEKNLRFVSTTLLKLLNEKILSLAGTVFILNV